VGELELRADRTVRPADLKGPPYVRPVRRAACPWGCRHLDLRRFPGNPAMVEELHHRLLSGLDTLELTLRRVRTWSARDRSAAPIPMPCRPGTRTPSPTTFDASAPPEAEAATS